MNDDAVLLRRYADEGSEAAFTELVRRHVDLVYAAALRRTGGDAHAATDVAQQVFIALARHAGSLSRHTVLEAWLHTATRNAALNFMISEQRRKAREMEAQVLAPGAASVATDPGWERLRPVLDAAIDELPEADRTAVVLRFLERRAFADIGATLHVSEDAARMRTDRAVEKLRGALARRGITSTAAALGALVSSQPLVSAPAGLAAVFAAQSLAVAGAGGGFLAAFLSLMNLKIIVTATLSGLVCLGIGRYAGREATADVSASPQSVDVLRQSQLLASLRGENLALKAEVDRLKADVELLDTANARLTTQRATPPPAAAAPRTATIGVTIGQQQRAVLNNLRQIVAARDQYELENKQPPVSIHELVGGTRYIKTVRTVGGEDYSALSMAAGQPLTVTTPGGMTVTYDPSGSNSTRPEWNEAEQHAEDLGNRLDPAIRKAIEAFRKANGGKYPSNEQAALPYFATPQEGADYVEYLAARKAAGF